MEQLWLVSTSSMPSSAQCILTMVNSIGYICICTHFRCRLHKASSWAFLIEGKSFSGAAPKLFVLLRPSSGEVQHCSLQPYLSLADSPSSLAALAALVGPVPLISPLERRGHLAWW